MLDALWSKFQSRGQPYADIYLKDGKTRLLWFNELRNKYVDNENLGECGVKVKYTEIFDEWTFSSNRWRIFCFFFMLNFERFICF